MSFVSKVGTLTHITRPLISTPLDVYGNLWTPAGLVAKFNRRPITYSNWDPERGEFVQSEQIRTLQNKLAVSKYTYHTAIMLRNCPCLAC